jgi:hypothetical protein
MHGSTSENFYKKKQWRPPSKKDKTYLFGTDLLTLLSSTRPSSFLDKNLDISVAILKMTYLTTPTEISALKLGDDALT